ncbi:MAG: HEPN domain-containing protein [Chlorobiales bacterium]|nr:HEPN domain-containing protein [Chlorobiales bacterium]
MFEERKDRSFPCGQEAGIQGAGCCSGRPEDFAEEFEAERLQMGYVQAYYAMFHAARTLLYHQGYREKSHYCLILAMKSFYVSKGVLEMRLVESLQMAKALREGADYENTFDPESAKALVAQAQEFVQVAEGVIARD